MNYDDMVKGLVSKIVIARIVARQPKKISKNMFALMGSQMNSHHTIQARPKF
jgi:hypothetical protein